MRTGFGLRRRSGTTWNLGFGCVERHKEEVG